MCCYFSSQNRNYTHLELAYSIGKLTVQYFRRGQYQLNSHYA
jgi:hypothetical protein